MSDVRPVTVIVLAAGAGTRMKSRTSKLLHPIGGRTLIGHALAAAEGIEPDRVVAVTGHDREQVEAHIAEIAPDAATAVQQEQNGTGHAVRCGLTALPEQPSGTVVVTYGDVPLLEAATVRAFVGDHQAGGRDVSVLTAEVDDPTGYGRIVRDSHGAVSRIVEQKDATDAERAIREINSGIFAFDAAYLVAALARIGTDNAQGEMYLTDVVEIARADERVVGAYVLDDVWQTEGVNNRVQLATLGAELNRRTLRRWMLDGVTVVDPDATWVDVTVRLAPDVTLLPGVQLHGATEVASGATIGPDTTLTDVTIGERAQVVRTHGSGAVIGAGATVGPFAYLRPGTSLGDGAKIGTYVETKQATIGDGAKVPHLSYVGDATVGDHTNIGAGTIFANYDGMNKHRTTVGRHCKTGSNNVFVAPVTIGDGAATGGGTTVRDDVPPGALAVSAGPQRNIDGWVFKRRAGTPAADAAGAAAAGSADVVHTDSAATSDEE
ncbi:bifunctional UDP-N-acetylglucosamine diphosphorylase/glucosamine-1-phosphate N-acetyltransferase GlmU [Solicola gregarius]|uniref:Bifunctional protein GlmU n=1 Tax=Solicola gregarius TaxID=2908642 RepID=A0AA46TJS5_9ACTN|nr:bifunctional UDP-N-acetylglucosamine diphosphorylase/glucosamine-1-phosphate N-acetyltransferase GlmU [Solicola gregarius]UYM06565.1 bifunctional UDP-N-acetylglucosamine diphosphorylase/glucosamine-1-phosphate N-acetyltransferase GlmU [Solicola gregarius]